MLFHPPESFSNEGGEADLYVFEMNKIVTEVSLNGGEEDDQTELVPDGIDPSNIQEFEKQKLQTLETSNWDNFEPYMRENFGVEVFS